MLLLRHYSIAGAVLHLILKVCKLNNIAVCNIGDLAILEHDLFMVLDIIPITTFCKCNCTLLHNDSLTFRTDL